MCPNAFKTIMICIFLTKDLKYKGAIEKLVAVRGRKDLIIRYKTERKSISYFSINLLLKYYSIVVISSSITNRF